MRGNLDCQKDALGRPELSATPSGNVRSLRAAVIAAPLMMVALAFGMTMPNVMNATMQPLPEIAGVVGAAAGSIQMTAGAASSGLVAILFDGRSAFSMAAVSSLLALIAYCLLARPAERLPAAIEGAMHL